MDTTSTGMIYATYNATLGLIQQTGVPTFYVFLTIFFLMFGLAIGWRAFIGGTRAVGRAVTHKRF